MKHLIEKHWLNSHRDFLINPNEGKKLLDYLEKAIQIQKIEPEHYRNDPNTSKGVCKIYIENNLFYLDLHNLIKYKIVIKYKILP